MNTTDDRYRLPSASRLDTAEKCPGSMVLDSIDTTTSDNAWGTSMHSFVLVRSVEIGRDAALDEIADKALRDRCAAIDLSRIPPGAEREVALALNWKTWEARKIGVNISREERAALVADLGPDWFQGTIDVLGATPHVVVLLDLKTGEQKVTAEESLQLGFAAVAASALTGLEQAEVAMLYEGHGGRTYEDRATLYTEDLSLVRTRLRAIAESRLAAIEDVRAGRLPVLRDGPWCGLCSSQRFCPAMGALVRTVTDGWSEETAESRALAMTDEEAGVAWEKVALARKITKAAHEALKARAKQRPIPLPSRKLLPSGEAAPAVKYVAEVPHGERERFTDFAKGRIADAEEEMRTRGEYQMVPAYQVRAVSAKTAQKAMAAKHAAQLAAERALEAEQGEAPIH